ncbi:MarR family transcriptional regulator [Fructobacillus sp. M2-14]|uniref:MarR family transcriptional regulator n=1 Tax=Fructobacillus broussonetiae TaxID=2713173 RepID=A0ABS5QY86_9LACO|nr:MarR family transcriptional regulator [Fructobacillus broussonetiae]MBS9338154.1 MarR family transcriptional regulator [Fructobacillus broussonetiae]
MTQEIKESNIALIYFAYQEFSQNIDFAHYQISKTQHRILFLVSQLSRPTIKKLLSIMKLSKQGFTKALKELEERNLILTKPSKDDPRVKDLILTKEGKEMIEALNQDQSQKIDALLQKHDGDWKKTLDDMVDNYLEYF